MNEKSIRVKVKEDEVLDAVLDKTIKVGNMQIPVYKPRSFGDVEVQTLNTFGGDNDDIPSNKR